MSPDAPSSAAGKAWAWSTTHSPLVRASRWLVNQTNRQRQANEIIRAANLPDGSHDRIVAITRRTRLWPAERADIARELSAHARDAIESGRDSDDLLSSLGDPKTVAPLLRRSAKRKRHWIWRARRRAMQACASLAVLLFLIYAVMFVRFNTGSPTIKHDYLAQLNARNNGFDESEKAYPAYLNAWLAWTSLSDELRDLENELFDPFDVEREQTAYRLFPQLATDAPLADELADRIVSLEPIIIEVRAAARLPTLGSFYSTRSETITHENGKKYQRPIPPEPNPEDRDALVATLLVDVPPTRTAAKLLVHDAYRAAAEGDAERTRENIEAAFGIARQVSEEPFLISDMVAIAIQHLAEDTLLRITRDNPELLGQASLVRLAHVVASTGSASRDLDLQSERLWIADMLQRTFTDDGSDPENPNGRLTRQGLQYLSLDSDGLGMHGTPTTASALVGPLVNSLSGGRRAHHETAERMFTFCESVLADGPEALARFGSDSPYHQLVESGDPLDKRRFGLIIALMPNHERVVELVFQSEARTNAALVAIAAQIHRQRTGSWPDSIDALTPSLLPEVPRDPFSPGCSLRMRVDKDGPAIYSVGTDGDDDGGFPHPEGKHHVTAQSLIRRYIPEWDRTDRWIAPIRRMDKHAEIPDCDWVLYPPED